jgi:hypothetical protein
MYLALAYSNWIIVCGEHFLVTVKVPVSNRFERRYVSTDSGIVMEKLSNLLSQSLESNVAGDWRAITRHVEKEETVQVPVSESTRIGQLVESCITVRIRHK